MTLEFKTQYLKAIRTRYFNGSKKRKTEILNELCAVTAYSRKHAIRVLSTGHITGKKSSGRTRAFSKEAKTHLQKLWHLMGRICSKKMVSAIPIWLEYYEREDFTFEIREELMQMSSSTIDRYLKTYKRQFARRKRTGTRRSKKFKNIIPIKNFDANPKKPGYVQADTVAHCGNSMSGLFIWTMTVTDEHSGWTENRAMWAKGGGSPLEAICTALGDLPFEPISFNTDNGSEFINREIHNYITVKNKIHFTRSRPYKSNDNAHVEQKNFTHVREIFGYERYDFEDLVDSMNTVYRKYFCVLQNFFIPQQKLISKVRHGSKYVKKYDVPKTPYQRLMDSSEMSTQQKNLLREKFETLNPIQLKKDVNFHLKLFKMQHKELKAKKQALIDYYEETTYKPSPRKKAS
jgi:hypothetical protein